LTSAARSLDEDELIAEQNNEVTDDNPLRDVDFFDGDGTLIVRCETRQ
jgi:hypothetical protein